MKHPNNRLERLALNEKKQVLNWYKKKGAGK